jgi:hypothetical protein
VSINQSTALSSFYPKPVAIALSLLETVILEKIKSVDVELSVAIDVEVFESIANLVCDGGYLYVMSIEELQTSLQNLVNEDVAVDWLMFAAIRWYLLAFDAKEEEYNVWCTRLAGAYGIHCSRSNVGGADKNLVMEIKELEQALPEKDFVKGALLSNHWYAFLLSLSMAESSITAMAVQHGIANLSQEKPDTKGKPTKPLLGED